MALSLRHLIRVVSWIFLLAATSWATAQTPTAPSTFRLIALGTSEPFIYDAEAGRPRTIYSGTNNFSDPMPLPPGGMLTFYRLGQSNTPGQPAPRLPIAEIRVPTGENYSILIVLIPGGLPARPLPVLSNGIQAEFSALVIDNSDAASPANTMRVISFSKRPAGVRWGETVAQLAPFETKLIPYPPGTRARFELATLFAGQWKPVVSSTQMISQGTKLTLFITDPPSSPEQPDVMNLNMQQILEVLPAAAR